MRPSCVALCGQHRLAGDIADGQDVRIGRAERAIDLDKALLVHLHLRVFQTEALAVRAAADGDQHAIVASRRRTWPAPSKATSTCLIAEAQRSDLRVQEDAVAEEHAQPLVQRLDQVAIGAGQQAVGQFDHAHL